MGDGTFFADLPIEIASYICSLLEQFEVSHLAQSTKSIYYLVRPILYRHPKIDSYRSLICFQRTLVRANWTGMKDHKWSSRDCIDQTKSLDLTIDPTRDRGAQMSQPSAMIISRVIKSIAERCPSVDITLQFAHCRCESSPISVLDNEEFPRVRRLVIYVGRNDPEETHLPRRSKCVPNAKFFRPFVSGLSFPDLKELAVRHYWATTPPTNAGLDIEDQSDVYAFMDCPDLIVHSDGLGKLESIMLESVPELDSAVLMQLVGNPKAAASNLTTLDLRFCALDLPTVADLLYHAPPRLKRLSLLLGHRRPRGLPNTLRRLAPRVSEYSMSHQKQDTDTHLCPLIRQYSKRLERLDYGAAHTCRQLFFDDDEISALHENGIISKIGERSEAIDSKTLDSYAIEQAIQTVRQCRRAKERQYRVRETLHERGVSTKAFDSAEASTGPNGAERKVQREIEALLDDEEAQRRRLVTESSTRWTRRIIALGELCDPGDTWAEMKIAADMEERGVQWVLANKPLQLASWHTNGEPSVALEYKQAVEEYFQFDRF